METDESIHRRDLTDAERRRERTELINRAVQVTRQKPENCSQSEQFSSPVQPSAPDSVREIAKTPGVSTRLVHKARAHEDAVQTYPELEDEPQSVALQGESPAQQNWGIDTRAGPCHDACAATGGR